MSTSRRSFLKRGAAAAVVVAPLGIGAQSLSVPKEVDKASLRAQLVELDLHNVKRKIATDHPVCLFQLTKSDEGYIGQVQWFIERKLVASGIRVTGKVEGKPWNKFAYFQSPSAPCNAGDTLTVNYTMSWEDQ